jgi:hypothetical protein
MDHPAEHRSTLGLAGIKADIGTTREGVEPQVIGALVSDDPEFREVPDGKNGHENPPLLEFDDVAEGDIGRPVIPEDCVAVGT